MKKYFKFIPLPLWLIYFLKNYNQDSQTFKEILQTIAQTQRLYQEYATPNNFSNIYYTTALAPFFDEISLLIIASALTYILYKKYK